MAGFVPASYRRGNNWRRLPWGDKDWRSWMQWIVVLLMSKEFSLCTVRKRPSVFDKRLSVLVQFKEPGAVYDGRKRFGRRLFYLADHIHVELTTIGWRTTLLNPEALQQSKDIKCFVSREQVNVFGFARSLLKSPSGNKQQEALTVFGLCLK